MISLVGGSTKNPILIPVITEPTKGSPDVNIPWPWLGLDCQWKHDIGNGKPFFFFLIPTKTFSFFLFTEDENIDTWFGVLCQGANMLEVPCLTQKKVNRITNFSTSNDVKKYLNQLIKGINVMRH